MNKTVQLIRQFASDNYSGGEVTGLKPMFPRQADSVFLELPSPVIQTLQATGWRFYTFIGVGGVRLMCSWNTPLEAVDQWVSDLQRALTQSRTAERR